MPRIVGPYLLSFKWQDNLKLPASPFTVLSLNTPGYILRPVYMLPVLPLFRLVKYPWIRVSIPCFCDKPVAIYSQVIFGKTGEQRWEGQKKEITAFHVFYGKVWHILFFSQFFLQVCQFFSQFCCQFLFIAQPQNCPGVLKHDALVRVVFNKFYFKLQRQETEVESRIIFCWRKKCAKRVHPRTVFLC